jgi:hypothetical protein
MDERLVSHSPRIKLMGRIPYSAIATDIDPTGPVITSSTKQDTRALVCDYVTQVSSLLMSSLMKRKEYGTNYGL